MIDSLGMLDATRRLPEQMLDALDRVEGAEGLPPADGIRSVVLLGMGGSGIAADVAAAVVGPTCPVPVVVSKQYECPGFVGADTLVVAVSFSGNTEETIAAVHGAVGAGARLVVVCSGGHLERTAREWGAGVVHVDPDIPMPRAGVGAMAVATLDVLERMGLASDATAQIHAAVRQLRTRLERLGSDDGPVRDIARRIGRTLPIVYGGGALGEVAAARWKGQFNENPKVAAFANRVPELTHNEICGWAQHGDVTRQVFTLLLLRHDHEHPQVARRFELVEEYCDEVVGDILTVRAAGDGQLAQLMDLVLVGDLVSLQLAADASVDPGPVPILDDIKVRIAQD